MRKDALLKALSGSDGGFNQQEPAERPVFLYDEEMRKCSSILHSLIQTSQLVRPCSGNRHALPLPDVDLPLIF
ncbi:hypothetical protein [Burkholderia vietnamiensis]|uniref:hypothetical protein n=1 Tax=Burkholderia vietnamiensis TaxID=60552 RepID=UPI000ABD4FA1|nr:hypothetical protein [Burkholderia vietnamiensis]MDN7412750.1 hypothetical protein [Burkholderia vietnamiensis]